LIDKTISHYKILEKIGEGGMGIVYKAEDIKLKRMVALKFLPPEFYRDKDAKERFLIEAQAAAALEHPNICNIHEINETDVGQMFLSMAYYKGETLRDKIKCRGEVTSPLPLYEAINIALQIAEGLQAAHEKGVVHRDIKSANIMITEQGQVKIMDFGLAKLKGQSKFTKEGTTLGTAAYMSPEQAMGEDVDHKTDIWSLGVVLYEMLTGRLPFKGDYEQAVIYSIMNEKPEPVTDLRTGIPLDLERLINKALAKKPKSRYQHVDELLVDLHSIKELLKSTPSQTKTIKNPSLKSNKRIWPYALAAAIPILIVAGYFLIKGPLQKEETIPIKTPASKWENSIAVLPFVDLSPEKDQEYFCDGMTEQIISNLTKLQKLKVTARTSVMKFKKTDKTIPQIGSELKVAYVLEGSVRKVGSQIRITAQLINVKDGFHLLSEEYDKEYKNIFDIWDDISQQIAQVLLKKLTNKKLASTKTKRPNNLEAYNLYLKAGHIHKLKYLYGGERRPEVFKNAEALFKKSIELDPNYAPTYAGLADLYDSYANFGVQTEEERKIYHGLSERYTQKAFNLDPTSAQVLFMKGLVCYKKGEIDRQWDYYKEAYRINPNDAYINRHIGIFFRERGLYYQAIQIYNKVIELDPLYYFAIRDKAWFLAFYLGEYPSAEKICQAMLEQFPKDRVTGTYSWLLVLTKRFDEAEEMIEKYVNSYPESNFAHQLKALKFAIHGEKEKALAVKLNKTMKARIYPFLEMKEEFFQFIVEDSQLAKKRKGSNYLWYKNNPIHDFLRSDPHFQKILAEHKELYDENLKKYGDLEVH
jgi:serine/threonine protein kinase/tetratricopeptide (TPR) repeat protein